MANDLSWMKVGGHISVHAPDSAWERLNGVYEILKIYPLGVDIKVNQVGFRPREYILNQFIVKPFPFDSNDAREFFGYT